MPVLCDPAYVAAGMSRDITFLVIGGSGWMGRATLDILFHLLGQAEFERRVVVVGSSARQIEISDGISVTSQALIDWRGYISGEVVVFHYSFLTKDKVQNYSLSDYVAVNGVISERVGAILTELKPRALFLPSSGAVYDASGGLERDVERNPYGALKVREEEKFGDLMNQLGGRCIIPRIFGLSGEYINKHQAYALAAFILDAQAGRPIEIRARHDVFRSYMYVGDAIGLGLWLSLRPGGGEGITFDMTGEEIVEIADLAARVTKALEVPMLPIVRTRDPSLAADRYVGDGTLLESLLRQAGARRMTLDSQILRTAAFLASRPANDRI